MVYSFENPQQAFEIGLIEPAQVNTRPSQLANGQRFLKLVNDPTNEANNDNSNLDSDSSIERTQPEVNNGQQQQGPIAVNARSPMQGSRNGLSLPKKFITNMLYGRSSASSLAVPNYGVYNKKAEPKDNFFMHFG